MFTIAEQRALRTSCPLRGAVWASLRPTSARSSLRRARRRAFRLTSSRCAPSSSTSSRRSPRTRPACCSIPRSPSPTCSSGARFPGAPGLWSRSSEAARSPRPAACGRGDQSRFARADQKPGAPGKRAPLEGDLGIEQHAGRVRGERLDEVELEGAQQLDVKRKARLLARGLVPRGCPDGPRSGQLVEGTLLAMVNILARFYQI